MRKFYVFLLAVAVSVPVLSCAQTKMVRLTRYEGKRITGISAAGAFEVELNRDDRGKAVVEIAPEWEERLRFDLTPEGIVKVSVRSKDGKSLKGNEMKGKMKLKVWLPELQSVELAGVCTAVCRGDFKGDRVKIDVTGVSRLWGLNLEAQEAEITCSGVSKADLAVTAPQIKGKCMGCSTLAVHAEGRTSEFMAAGPSKLQLSGSAGEARLGAGGVSSVTAEDYKVARLHNVAAGVSHITSWAVDSIVSKAGGTSRIRYRGTPGFVDNRAGKPATIRKIK